jgi:hypothetical protein
VPGAAGFSGVSATGSAAFRISIVSSVVGVDRCGTAFFGATALWRTGAAAMTLTCSAGMRATADLGAGGRLAAFLPFADLGAGLLAGI